MKEDYSECLVLDEEAENLFSAGDSLNAPEKRLLYAMCERSVRDLFSSSMEERDSAISWLNDNEGNEPFSFPWICEILDLDRTTLLSKIWSLYAIGANASNASRELYFLIDKNNTAPEKMRAAA